MDGPFGGGPSRFAGRALVRTGHAVDVSHPASHPEASGLKQIPEGLSQGGGSEGQAGGKDVLDQRGRRNEIFQPEVEDPLDAVHREGA